MLLGTVLGWLGNCAGLATLPCVGAVWVHACGMWAATWCGPHAKVCHQANRIAES